MLLFHIPKVFSFWFIKNVFNKDLHFFTKKFINNTQNDGKFGV